VGDSSPLSSLDISVSFGLSLELCSHSSKSNSEANKTSEPVDQIPSLDSFNFVHPSLQGADLSGDDAPSSLDVSEVSEDEFLLSSGSLNSFVSLLESTSDSHELCFESVQSVSLEDVVPSLHALGSSDSCVEPGDSLLGPRESHVDVSQVFEGESLGPGDFVTQCSSPSGVLESSSQSEELRSESS
jgi:hypothetical protein